MRDGQRYEEQQVKKWLENFHSRLEFFEQYVTSHNQQMHIPKKKVTAHSMNGLPSIAVYRQQASTT